MERQEIGRKVVRGGRCVLCGRVKKDGQEYCPSCGMDTKTTPGSSVGPANVRLAMRRSMEKYEALRNVPAGEEYYKARMECVASVHDDLHGAVKPTVAMFTIVK
jgi:uncharacterized Zn finger protein (UPF0148 family)